MEERRAHQRYACDLRARVLTPDGRELEGRTIDISFAGICLHTSDHVDPKTSVEFRVWAVLPDRDTDEIAMPGRIVWSTPTEGEQQLGGTFDRDMDNRAWARLDMLLQYLAGNLDTTDRL